MSFFLGRKSKISSAVFIILSGVFLFSVMIKNAQAVPNDYVKDFNGTLTAAEWNNLLSDFVNTFQSAVMTGPLGIGTTTAPASGLFVNGPVTASNFTGSLTSFIGAQNVTPGEFGSNQDAGGNFIFGATGNMAASRIGIGTTNPIGKLAVNSNANPTQFSIFSTVNNSLNRNWSIIAGDREYGDLSFRQSNAKDGDPYTDGTARLYFRNDGNIGIGTTAPGSKLTLSGGDFAIDNNKSIIVNSASASTTLLLGNYGDGGAFFYGASSSPVRYAANLAIEGDIKGNRLCIQEDCKAAWSDIVASGGGGQWTTLGSNIYNANTGNVGIGTTTAPTAKLDINGSLRWGGGQIINSSDLINTFPYDELVVSWEPTKEVFRYYVDGVSGSDSNNGQKMSTAFRQIQTAIDQLPSDLRGYEAYILVGEGTYSPVNVTRISNGTLTFEWIGTGIESGTASNFKSWVLQGESGVITRNGAAQIISPDTTVAFKKEAGGLPLAIRFFSYERLNGQENVSWSNNYGARWRFGATGNAEWLITIWDQVSYFFAPQIELDLGNADGGMVMDSSFTIWNIRIYGGSGLASVAPAWSWKVPIALVSPNNTWQELCAWVGYKDSSMPLSSYVYLEGVKDAIRTGDRTDAFLDTGRCYEGGNKFRYAQGSSAFAKSNIYVDPFFKGMMVRNDSEFNFIDTSQDFHSVINTVNGKIDAISNNSNNFGIGTTTPAAKLHVYGNTRIGEGDAGVGSPKLTITTNETNADLLIQSRFAATEPSASLTFYNVKSSSGGTTGRINVTQADYQNNYMSFETESANTSSERMRIHTNGYIGIGTTAPVARLDVGGTGGFKNSYATTLSALGSGGNVMIMADNSGVLYSTSTASFISTNGLSLWSGAKNGTIWNGDAGVGNVGIGTTAPTAKLEIVGGHLKVNTDNYFGSGTGNSQNTYIFTGGTGQIGLRIDGRTGQTADLQVWNIDSGSTNVAKITASGGAYFVGNVGIGTTNPVAKLDITSVSNVTDVASSSADYLNIWNTSLSIANTKFGIVFGASATYPRTAGIFANGNYDNNANTSLVFATRGLTGDIQERMRINYDGNVGIGTTAPLARLDVGGTGGFKNSYSTTLSALGSGGNVMIMADNSGVLYSTSTASFISTNSLSLWAGTKNGTIWNGDAGVGNVGIGTTNPAYKFQVEGGDIALTIGSSGSSRMIRGASGASTYTGIDFGNTSSHLLSMNAWGGMDFTVDSNNNESNQSFRFLRDSGTEIMRIVETGNVGIGTTAPAYTLDLTASGVARAHTYNLATGSIQSNGSGVRFQSGSQISFDTPTSGDTKMYIQATSGNVGIGTTAPVARLDVGGTGGFKNSYGTTLSALGSGGNVLIMADNTGVLYSTSTAAFVGSTSFWGGTKNGNIWNGDAGVGNVGIGTTTPLYKLEILGTLKASASSSSIILDSNGNILIGI